MENEIVRDMYGIDRDLEKKLKRKYDQESVAKVQAWISALTGYEWVEGFGPDLRSGVVLCQFINCLQPNLVKKYSNSSQPFKQRENIVKYISACRKLGLKETDIFPVNDLFEAQNLSSVLQNLICVNLRARALDGFSGPFLDGAEPHRPRVMDVEDWTEDIDKPEPAP